MCSEANGLSLMTYLHSRAWKERVNKNSFYLEITTEQISMITFLQMWNQ